MWETADLPAALGRIRRVTGLPVAFGGVVSADGRQLRLSEFAGTATPALHGLIVSAGNGLGGRVVTTARPGRVEDYAADPRISHEYDAHVGAEGLRAIAAVPVALGGPGLNGSVLAVLYAGTREPIAVGGRAVEAMGRVALRLGTEATVRREVARRMAELETAAVRGAPGTTSREWEDVRLAHADLRTLAAETSDPALRARLQQISDRLIAKGPGAAEINPLSPRELDVLAMVAVGCGNAEAARRLGLLPETVKSYLRNAMRKLGTHGRMETIVTARRLGYLP
ncbi:helix-turn-helix transcriptional regulator [Paractinoplanes globisporus]|uniref:LuxR C-terminal-related transcriptional regulator n=1 Tax=Paractinoplanes globisporus TaxID=113565 RepID=A0ABW6WJE8_9ACTN|nr:LuxR C-terminal-related transcriptional regulator [Actinoplanes globisporus]